MQFKGATDAHNAGKLADMILHDQPMIAGLIKWYLANHWADNGIDRLIREIHELGRQLDVSTQRSEDPEESP